LSRSVRLFAYCGAILAGLGLLAACGAFLFVWLGAFNVAASSGHSNLAYRVLHFAMRRSVAARAGEGKTPDLSDPVLILRGANHFQTGCAPCHGAPGEPRSPVANGITPPPPRLASAREAFDPHELHWIVKNGVKMTAMPAWPTAGRDDEVWALVAFLDQLPMLPRDYGRLRQPPEQRAAADTPAVVSQCARCHGFDGNGRDGAFPKLAGLAAPYLENALNDFRTGARPSGFMRPVAATLSAQDTKAAVDYYAAQSRSPAGAMLSASLRDKGEQIASVTGGRDGPACMTCHRLRDAERNPEIPQLAGQSARYIGEQLLLFRRGVRASTPNARVMAGIAQRLSDDDIAAVAAYFAALSPAQEKPAQVSELQ
jgi:cytochrome c553